jgi:CBS domain-containing protein
MKNKKLRRIPVIDKNKKLVGLVTNFDLAILGWDTE